jgi:sulfite reductase beta subunit-like hemoprotein
MSRPPDVEPSWELVHKRNSIERMKAEKGGLSILADLPALIASGYEEVPEEDMVRLQWYGAYHDKPKLGFFMLRAKIPGGDLDPRQLRTLGELSRTFGRNHGELTTRQNIQLHWIEMARLPEVLATLEGIGFPSRGACGDNVRNVTGCPVSGIDRGELFDCRPLLAEIASYFVSKPEFADLPRKHKITVAACPHQCNAPEIHCIALVGTLRDGVQGFGVRVGGGLSSFPRLADDLGVFVPAGEAIPVLEAILDVWRTDLRYRLSRARARLKFMVHDLGPAAFRARVEERLGRKLDDGACPPGPAGEHDHTGIHPQIQDGLVYAGFPVHLGLITGDQMVALADLSETYGGGIRFTRRQNFLLTDVPEGRVDEVVARVGEIGFPINAGGLRELSIACTGDPYCNYTVAETKGRLDDIVTHLERVFGAAVAGLRINLDGCPHACSHHWIGDIGLQGTTLRERGASGEKLQGYDLFLRGGLGREAAIGRPVLRRVPGDVVHLVMENLFRSYLDARRDTQEAGESVQQFFIRHTDDELTAMAGITAAPAAAH